MNSSETNASSVPFRGLQFESYTRVWLFDDVIDGIWILCPIAIFGTIVNSFMVSISFPKTRLQNCTKLTSMYVLSVAYFANQIQFEHSRQHNDHSRMYGPRLLMRHRLCLQSLDFNHLTHVGFVEHKSA